MATVPEIVIQGRTYQPNPPKARIWREVVAFEQAKYQGESVDFVDGHARIIADAFGRDEITPEVILDNLALEEVMPLYHDVYLWIMELIGKKLKQIPNGETAPESI